MLIVPFSDVWIYHSFAPFKSQHETKTHNRHKINKKQKHKKQTKMYLQQMHYSIQIK